MLFLFVWYSSSLSPRDYEYEHVTSRKKRRGVIEKRRRDRINHCLTELRRLVPQAISKEGSTKLEKAEILQMTVDHLRTLPHMNKGISTFKLIKMIIVLLS
jgi:hypothetical protein